MKSAFGELKIITKEKNTGQQNGEMEMTTIFCSRMVRSMVKEL
jgi:hypothetical protein